MPVPSPTHGRSTDDVCGQRHVMHIAMAHDRAFTGSAVRLARKSKSALAGAVLNRHAMRWIFFWNHAGRQLRCASSVD
jgi:hypothetical protein